MTEPAYCVRCKQVTDCTVERACEYIQWRCTKCNSIVDEDWINEDKPEEARG